MVIRPFIQRSNRACSILYRYIKGQKKGVWLLPVNVCPDVPLTFSLADIPFEFVDINSETLCIDVDECIRRTRKRRNYYIGVVYVRTYGYLFDTTEVFNSLKSDNSEFIVIDDRCLCIPDTEPDFYGADMILYSTGHCKQIDLGTGGLALFDKNPDIAFEDVDLLYDGTDEVSIYKKSYEDNTPLDSIPKGWLRLEFYDNYNGYLNQIKNKVSHRISQRESINSVYKSSLPEEIQLSSKYQNWRFNIRVSPKYKDKILKSLFNENLFAGSHYHSANKLYDTTVYKNSDALYGEILNLFNDDYYTVDKATQTCELINKIIH